MNRLELAEEPRKTADWLAAGFEVDKSGMTLADAIAALRMVSDDYFCISLRVSCHGGGDTSAKWETYGFPNPKKTFESTSLAGLVAAVQDHVAEPATVAAVEAEIGRGATTTL